MSFQENMQALFFRNFPGGEVVDDFGRLVRAVARYFEADPEMICSSTKKRGVSHLSDRLLFAVDQLMMSGTAVAGELRLSPSAISKLVARGRSDEPAGNVADSVFHDK